MTNQISSSRVAVAGIGIVSAAVMLSGCSSGGSGRVAAAGGATANSTAGTPSAAAARAGTATCTQVTTAQVQPLLVAKITASAAVPAPASDLSLGGTGQLCTFAVAGSASAISILVIGGADADPYYQSQIQSLAQATAVPGVGDKAIRDASDSSSAVTAEQNGMVCTVDTSSADQLPGVNALMKAAGDTSDIGDTNWSKVAAALGTLCNVVYGSGNTTPDFSGLTAAASAASTASPAGGSLPTNFSVPTDGSTP